MEKISMGIPIVPTIIEKTAGYERAFDIYSYLLKNRIIFLSGEVNDHMATSIAAQLIFLQSQDAEKDIHIYINSPGGSVYAGFSIIDTMNFVKCDVQTWAIGLAASCGSLILSAGAPGKRHALPNARIMLHEPSGGFQGRSLHMEDHANEIIYIRKKIHNLYKHSSNKNLSDADLEKYLNRESFFDPETAKKLGLIDNIVTNQSDVENK
jgi:ATP-dependent Clp protease protease subunit